VTKVELSELNKSILNDTLVQLKDLLEAESASLFLVDKDHQDLVLNSVFNEQKVQFKGIRQRMNEGVAGTVASKGEAVLVTDIKTDPRFAKERFRHYHTNSFICIPIMTHYGLVGVINISDKSSREVFTERDFEVACLFGKMACRIVENEISLRSLKDENDILKKERAEIREEKAFLEKFASVGKLAGGIVHEINNPLDAVMRYTNMLVERQLDPATAKEYLNEIKIGLSRMFKITRSLLEFSQQLNENHRHEYIDINDTLEEALSLFRHTLFIGHITINKNFAEGLPKIADKGLCRVFSNIIKNAFDAMPEVGTLEITTKRSGDNIVISFKDSGTGIPEEVRKKIFTPFFTTKPIGQGIGLGLPICFEVIQRYEGKIDLNSEMGVGSEFRISLPLKHAQIEK